jgi:hypothetical protein
VTTTDSYSGVKEFGREKDHYSPCDAEVMNTLELYVHALVDCHGLSLIKNIDQLSVNFKFIRVVTGQAALITTA